MNKKLTFLELILHILSIALLYIDGMYIWIAAPINGEGKSTYSAKSFENIFSTQLSSIFDTLLPLLLVISILIIAVPLFKKNSIFENTYFVLLPAMIMIIYLFLSIGVDTQCHQMLSDGNGGMCSQFVEFGALFYVEMVMLVSMSFSRFYRVFGIKEKKFNETNVEMHTINDPSEEIEILKFERKQMLTEIPIVNEEAETK